MSIASRPAAPRIAVLLLLIVVIGPMQWQTPVRATDPTVNGAIAEQRRMESELARQRTQLAELQRSQADLAAQLHGITNDLISVGLQIELAAAQVDAMSLQLDQARLELATYEHEIDTLEATLSTLSIEIMASKAELVDRQTDAPGASPDRV